MPKSEPATDNIQISRERLAELLNEDLSREYQAIIAYAVYSQVLKGAAYMDIASQLEIHAKQELDHALTISRQIDYLGKMPTVTPKPVRTSENPKDMLRFDLENENETIRNYRDRVRQCEALGGICHGGTDSPDPGAGTGPPDRFGHGAGRRCSRRQQWSKEALTALTWGGARSPQPTDLLHKNIFRKYPVQGRTAALNGVFLTHPTLVRALNHCVAVLRTCRRLSMSDTRRITLAN